MRQPRRVLVWCLSGVLALPVVLSMTTGAASADARTCDPGEWCVWSGQFGGAFDQVAAANLRTDEDLENNTYDTDGSRNQHNTISSVWNRTNKVVKLFDPKGTPGLAMGCVGPGKKINLVNFGQPPWGDRTSSYEVQGDLNGC